MILRRKKGNYDVQGCEGELNVDGSYFNSGFTGSADLCSPIDEDDIMFTTTDIDGSPKLGPRNRRHPGVQRYKKAVQKLHVISQFKGNRRFGEEEQDQRKKKRVILNISGLVFETFESTLERYPETLLGNSRKRASFFEKARNEYFFNRNREAFEHILFFYQSFGKIVRPETISVKDFIEELQFFQMGDDVIERFKGEVNFHDDKTFNVTETTSWREKLWLFVEHPNSSTGAGIFAFLSVSVIVFSVVCFCMETIPFYKNSPGWKHNLEKAELFSIIWFTVEFVVRFIAAERKCAFMKTIMNLIDLIAILPFYITLPFKKAHTSSFSFLRTVRLVRVLRIFKLSRHMRVLKILGLTIKSSANELLLLAFFVSIAVVLFSSAAYYCEESFHSIPESFWWCVITLTNVGYGDLVPITGPGKFIGSLCAVAGVITLALPIPIIVSSFMYYYNMEKENQRNEKSVIEEGYRKKIALMKNIFGTRKPKHKFGEVSPKTTSSN